jgi:hypothetical protein
MNYLKADARTRSYLNMANKKTWAIIRFFFDFRAKKSTSNNLEGLLRSIICQIILEILSLVPYVTPYGKEPTIAQEMDQVFCWDVGSLRKALMSGLKNCSLNFCMLVDGLDDFDASVSEMLDLLSFYRDFDNLDNSFRRIKVCLASRPEPLIIESLGNWCGFKLQDYNKLGIQEHLSSRLGLAAQTLGGSLDGNPTMELAKAITERARGVFLWARFTIDELVEGIAEGDDIDQLKARLEALPDDIQEIYAQILSRIQQKIRDMRETAAMLQMGAFTLRSLPLREFIVVLRHSVRKPVPGSCLMDKFFLKSFKKRILVKTGGLLEVLNTRDMHVVLIHETVLAYLRGLTTTIKVGVDSNISVHSSTFLYPLEASTGFVPSQCRPITTTSCIANPRLITSSIEGYSTLPITQVAQKMDRANTRTTNTMACIRRLMRHWRVSLILPIALLFNPAYSVIWAREIHKGCVRYASELIRVAATAFHAYEGSGKK